MWMGLDVGTTNVKAIVVDESGAICSQASRPVDLLFHDGGVEQDLEAIARAVLEAMREASARVDAREVEAVGVSSQGGAPQLRDHAGALLGRVVSWMDQRGKAIDQHLEEQYGRDWFAERTGHGGSAVGLLARALQSQPDRDRLRVTFVGDSIVERLCGRGAHDYSSLSICGLYNPWRRRADPDVLAEIGLDERQLPDLLPATEPAGRLLAEMADRTGLRAGIPVSVAVHDQYAASLGCGAVSAGDTVFGGGTAWVILTTQDRLMPPVVPAAWVTDHVLPERWGQLMSLGVGGSVFDLARKVTGQQDRKGPALDDLLDSVPPGCDGLAFHLRFSSRTDSHVFRGADVTGLQLHHTAAHLLRAAVEGLARALALRLHWFDQAGCPVTRLLASGGAVAGKVTPRILANTLQVPVLCIQGEMSALGAAILARAIVEGGADLAAIAQTMQASSRPVEPDNPHDPNRQRFLETLDHDPARR